MHLVDLLHMEKILFYVKQKDLSAATFGQFYSLAQSFFRKM
jgi:hypothetical protein